jgi:hypothetical protein
MRAPYGYAYPGLVTRRGNKRPGRGTVGATSADAGSRASRCQTGQRSAMFKISDI